MDIAAKHLQLLKKDRVFVDVYADHFDESLYGFIREYNDEFLLLEHYNNEILYNGIVVLSRNDITRIRWGNNEIQNSSYLVSAHDDEDKIEKVRIDSLESTLNSVQDAFGYVTIHMQHVDNGMCIIGQIQEIDATSILLKEYGTLKSLDRGMILLAMEDITRVDAGGLYERGLVHMHAVV
jgi:hypothetical protein